MPRPTTTSARVRLEHLAAGMIYKDPQGRPQWVTMHEVGKPVPHDSTTNTREAVISYLNGKNAGVRVHARLYDQGHKDHYEVQAGSVPDGYAAYPDSGGLTEPIRTPVNQLRERFPEIFARGEELGSLQEYLEYQATIAEHDGAPSEASDYDVFASMSAVDQISAVRDDFHGDAWIYPPDWSIHNPPQRVWRMAQRISTAEPGRPARVVDASTTRAEGAS